jgi:hypothetical protein
LAAGSYLYPLKRRQSIPKLGVLLQNLRKSSFMLGAEVASDPVPVEPAVANRIRASAHSFEARAFGIVTAGYMDAAMRSFLIERDPSVAEVIDHTQRAASFFVDPTGELIGDSLQDEEGIAYAEFDPSRCIEPKQFHDVVGYYNWFDVFDLKINRKRLVPATFFEAGGSAKQSSQRDVLPVETSAPSD